MIPSFSSALCLLTSVSLNEVPQYGSDFLQGRGRKCDNSFMEDKEQEEAFRLPSLYPGVALGVVLKPLFLQRRAAGLAQCCYSSSREGGFEACRRVFHLLLTPYFHRPVVYLLWTSHSFLAREKTREYFMHSTIWGWRETATRFRHYFISTFLKCLPFCIYTKCWSFLPFPSPSTETSLSNKLPFCFYLIIFVLFLCGPHRIWLQLLAWVCLGDW